MSIEILTVSLSDESIDRIVTALHARMEYPREVTQSNPPSPEIPQDAERSGFQQQGDPWLNQNPAPPVQQQYQPAPSTSAPQQQPQQQYQQPPAVQQGPPERYCPHGKMRFVPAGVSQAGRSYNAFYGCPLPKGTPGQCKSVTP